MIEIKYGDLFTTDALIVAHGCNCQGFMDAGVAKQVKNRMKHVFNDYKKICDADEFKLGDCQLVSVDDGKRYIANLATQIFTGANAQISAIEESLSKLIMIAKSKNIQRIAIPEIGCGSEGGLKLEDLHKILSVIVPEVGFVVELWEFKEDHIGLHAK